MKKALILSIFLTLLTVTINAQWQQTNGPYGGMTKCIALLGSNIFVGTQNNGIFLSTNNGSSWAPINNGLDSKMIYLLAVNGSTIYAATYAGVFTSSNNGSNWSRKGTLQENFTCFLFVDTTIFVGTQNNGVFKSSVNDTIWTTANIGLSNTWVNALAKADTYIFAGTENGGIFRSGNNGASWSASNNGITESCILSFCVDSVKIFAGGACNKLFTSIDNGNTWILANNGLTQSANSFAKDGSYIYAISVNDGVYRTNNHGASWTTVNNGLTNGWTNSIIADNANVYVSTRGDGIFYSGNNGNNWTQVNNGLIGTLIYSIEKVGNDIFAISDNDNYYVSDNNGISWQDHDVSSPYLKYGNLSSIAVSYPVVYLVSDSLYISSDSGNSWTSNSIPTLLSDNVLLVNDTDIFLGTYNQGVYLSHNDGATWTAMNNGFTNYNFISSMVMIGNNIIAGKLQNGIYVSNDYGTNWHFSGLSSSSVKKLLVHDHKVFVAALDGLYLSADTGQTWQKVVNSASIYSLAANDSIILAGTYDGVLLSLDGGYTWNSVNDGLMDLTIFSLLIKGSDVYAGTAGSGIWKRTLPDLLDDLIVSTPDYIDNSRFSLFPNPASFQLTIDAPLATNIEIFNISGQIVNSVQPTGINTVIDISGYSQGVYFVKIKTDKGFRVGKFIKE